jgi:hypothetical protein
MAERDISRFTDDPDLRQRISLLLAVLAGGPDHDQPGVTDANSLVDAIAFLAALLVEQSPEFTTPRHLRLGAEEFGRRTHEFVKAIREQRERTGTPVISAFAEIAHVIPTEQAGRA